MDCQEFRERLEQTLGRLCGQESELQCHGEECARPECRDAWEEFLLLEEAIVDWTHQVSRGQFSSSVQGAVTAGDVVREGSCRRASVWRLWGGVAVCLLALVWYAGHGGADAFRERALSHSVQEPLLTAERESPLAESVPSSGLSPRDEVFLVRDSVSAGMLVNWVAGTPLQVSGSMAILILQSHSVEVPASGWMPAWMEGWSEQIVPTRDDLELLRSLLLNSDRHSLLRQGHADTLLV